jgi:hypothetical protein
MTLIHRRDPARRIGGQPPLPISEVCTVTLDELLREEP